MLRQFVAGVVLAVLLAEMAVAEPSEDGCGAMHSGRGT
jgi:hypothetical protein